MNYANEAKDLATKLEFDRGYAYSLKNIGMVYAMQGKYPEALEHWKSSLEIFERIGDKVGESNMLNNIGTIYYNNGDDTHALENYLKSLSISEQTGNKLRIATALTSIANVYLNKKATHDKALGYFIRALPIAESVGDANITGSIDAGLGEIYFKKENFDSALFYFEKSAEVYKGTEYLPYALNWIGKVYNKRNEFSKAIQYHQQAYDSAMKLESKLDMIQSLNGLAKSYRNRGDIPLSISTYKQGETIANEMGVKNEDLKEIYDGLTKAYSESNDFENAFKYQKLLIEITETLYNLETDKKLLSKQFDYDLAKKQSEVDLKQSDLRRQIGFTIGGFVGLVIVAILLFFVFRNYNKQITANRLLKETQGQLVRQEKLAALGQMISGIAHEIQNPLNFVNNFSALSKDLVEELKDSPSEEDRNEVIQLLGDNLNKIETHGKRAGSIVKNMLDHSRTSGGEKVPIDLNKLSEEYMSLAFQAHKANRPDFNCQLEYDLLKTLPQPSAIAQEIGRVLLNIYNNAFDAVYERQTKEPGFMGVVKLSTELDKNKVLVKISDNGVGIPADIKEKIFQPFFTTKPTGQGTGLGLSLSYDIVLAHGGELIATSVLNEKTEFVLTLPM